MHPRHKLVVLMKRKFEKVGAPLVFKSFDKDNQKAADRSQETIHWFWRCAPTWAWVALNM